MRQRELRIYRTQGIADPHGHGELLASTGFQCCGESSSRGVVVVAAASHWVIAVGAGIGFQCSGESGSLDVVVVAAAFIAHSVIAVF
jgi:hypothetical protein